MEALRVIMRQNLQTGVEGRRTVKLGDWMLQMPKRKKENL
jgi:hypothetical protein